MQTVNIEKKRLLAVAAVILALLACSALVMSGDVAAEDAETGSDDTTSQPEVEVPVD